MSSCYKEVIGVSNNERRRQKEKPYKDYSDDSWFTNLMDGLDTARCCWPVAYFALALAIVIMTVLFY